MFGLSPETLQFTDEAVARLQELMNANPDAKGVCLRIADGKGCSGNEYKMELVSGQADLSEYDRVDYDDGATLFVPKKDALKLFGTQVHYGADNIGNRRFLFSNPNEKARCGCGESVSF